MSKRILLLPSFLLLFLTSGNSQKLFPYLKGELYGYADADLNIIIEPQYQEVTEFGNLRFFTKAYSTTHNNKFNSDPDNCALALKDSLWYLIDRQGLSLLGNGMKSKVVFTNFSKIYGGLSTMEVSNLIIETKDCLLYTSPSPRDATLSRMPSSA